MSLNKLVVALIRQYKALHNERQRLNRAIYKMTHSQWAHEMSEKHYMLSKRSIKYKRHAQKFIVNTKHSHHYNRDDYDESVFVSKTLKKKQLQAYEESLKYAEQALAKPGGGGYYVDCMRIQQDLNVIKNKPVSKLGKDWIKYVKLVLRLKRVEDRLFRTSVTMRTINKMKMGIKIGFGDMRNNKQSYSRIYFVETASSEPIPVKRWLDDQDFEAILE